MLKRAPRVSSTQCLEVIHRLEGRWEDLQSSANMPSLILTIGYPNPGNVNMNKSPPQNATGSTSSKKVIMILHSHNSMLNHKHPLGRFSKKSNFTTNSPSPPADYKNKNDSTPCMSLGRELPPLTCPIANRASDCSAHNLRIYSHNVQGLRGEEKLEYIMRLMKKKKLRCLHHTKNTPRRKLLVVSCRR